MAEEGQLSDMGLDALVTKPSDSLIERLSTFQGCMPEENFPGHTYLAKRMFAAPSLLATPSQLAQGSYRRGKPNGTGLNITWA